MGKPDNPTENEEPVRRHRVVHQISNWEPLIIQAGYSGHALAGLCGVSLRHLQRHVKATYGRTLTTLIETVRLLKARAMLATGCPVKVAALTFGYKQVSHFSRNFRNQFGMSPSRFVICAILGSQMSASKQLRDTGQ